MPQRQEKKDPEPPRGDAFSISAGFKDTDDVFGDHSAVRFTKGAWKHFIFEQCAAAVPRLTASLVSVCWMESDLTSLLSTLLQPV